ncbi:hypothetical protein HK097_003763 [Rhizophlyctis rosea]|uniref:Uncharacterized protein n=1 Tax=Rhizophlyctis rosea TaxID=64517 RepID=A0AAD5SI03_9FUNG|nr:hypothetical protein HK097_003763 [Rhizophlyctis rosea]
MTTLLLLSCGANAIYTLVHKDDWNPAALPIYSKYISVAFASLGALLAVLGLIASVIGSYRLLYYFIIPYRAYIVLTLAKSLALPIVVYLRKDILVAACNQWATDNPSQAPQKPDCGTATNFAVAFLATWGSIEFLFELWVYNTATKYRSALTQEAGAKAYTPLVEPSLPVQQLGNTSPGPVVVHNPGAHGGNYGTYGTYQKL